MTDREFRIWVGLAGLFFILCVWRGIAAAQQMFGAHP